MSKKKIENGEKKGRQEIEFPKNQTEISLRSIEKVGKLYLARSSEKRQERWGRREQLWWESCLEAGIRWAII